MSWSDINFTQKRFSLRKLTETKEEPLVATFSSWRNQKKQVVSYFKTSFCRLDRLIHSSFKSIIHYAIEKSRLVSGFETPLCRSYRTHAFWETKMLLNSNFNGNFNKCLWVWILLFRAHFWLSLGTKVCSTTFYFTNVRHDKWHHEGQKYYCFQFVKQNFKNLRYAFWADANRNTMEQKLFHIFLLRVVGAFERNIDLEPEKSLPKSTKNNFKYYF